MRLKQLGIILTMFTMALVSSCTTTSSASSGQARPAGSAGKPLKVYILAGQSNMQGQAQPFTIPRMALSPNSKALHDKILDDAGEPKVHKNVSIVYFTGGDRSKGEQRPLVEKEGLLAAGATGSIGPELAFGITMDEAVDQPILIIKTAWGGRSLFHHFRPPSAGKRPFERWKSNRPKSEEDWKEAEEEHFKTQGLYYRLIVDLVKKVLADPGQYCDTYDPKQGYEIAGFGWFQGFNDMIAGNADFYKAKDGRPQFAGHTDLLAHFIRDIRKDLDAPKMPFVIGVVGIGGESPKNTFRAAQAATADLPEFKGNVVTVPTAPYWDTEVEEAVKKVNKSDKLWETAEGWMVLGKPAPEDRVWHYTSFNVDEEKQYTKIHRYVREYNVLPPADLQGWLKPDFDTSTWQKGPAPIGKGTELQPRKKKKADDQPEEKQESLVRSPWGDGNTLLMKTTFTLERTDIAAFRLCLRSTRAFNVYLNGEHIKHFAYWNGTHIRKWDIDEKLVKQGENELAFYGNIEESKGSLFNAVDLYLEGLPKDNFDEIKKKQNEIAPPLAHELAKGQSNQDFHYLGSAYTYSLIGEAMAKAMIELQKTKQ